MLKQKVKFYQLNLVDDAAMRGMRGFNAIFCRNVLIYFDDISRRRVALYFYQGFGAGRLRVLGAFRVDEPDNHGFQAGALSKRHNLQEMKGV